MNSPFSHRPRDYKGAELTFDYSQNLVTIEWALFDFINPLKNKYYYCLDGFQDEWISVGSKTSATFTNLPGGHYTFRVKGANYNGVQVSQEASLRLHINPPFWQTLTFKILVFIGLVLSIYLLIRFKIGRAHV